MSRKKTSFIISALIIAIFIGVALKNVFFQASLTPSMTVLEDGTKQINYETALTKLDQSSTTFEAYKGKIVVVNFWASWCGPCQQEAPELEAFYQQKSKDVELLAINATAYDSYKKAAAFKDTYDLSFPIFLDEEGVLQKTFEVVNYPSTFIFDKEGKLQHSVKGELTQQQLIQLIDDL